MVWQRTFARLAGYQRADIHPALKKMWKKHYKVDGMVTQHLSPFEQNIVSNWFKELPSKFVKRTVEIVKEAGPGLGLGVAIFYYGDYKHKEIAYHHRV